MSLVQADRSILVHALLGALVPGAASTVILAAARPWSGRAAESAPARGWTMPLALGLAFPAGYLAINGWPPLPPKLGITQWLFYLGLIGGRWGAYEARRARSVRPAWLGASIAMPIVLLGFVREHQWSAVETGVWTSGLALALFLSWNVLTALESRVRLGPLLLGWTAVEALAAGAYQFSHSSVLAQLAGALVAALLPCAVLGFWRPAQGLPTGVVAPFLLLHSGLAWAAHFASYLGLTGFVLISLAPLAALLSLCSSRRSSLAVGLPALLSLLALLLEYRSASESY